MPEQIVLPQHLECEDNLIGLSLYDKSYSDALVSSLTPDDFVRPRNRLIFQAMASLSKMGTPIDVQSVCDHMVNSKTIDDAGGIDFIYVLLNSVVSFDQDVFQHHLKMVRSDTIARNFLDACDSTIKSWGQDPSQEPLSFIANSLPLIDQAANSGADNGFKRADEITPSFQENLARAKASDKIGLLGIDTGLSDLNKITHGWRAEQLIVLGARTSMGKTALALNFAVSAAKTGATVGFFSFEMNNQSLIKRLVARSSGVDGETIESGLVSPDQLQRIAHAVHEVEGFPIYFSDKNTGLIRDLIADASRLKLAHPDLKLIIIDYIGLLSIGGRVENRQNEIATISRKLKQLASSLKIAVILLAQLNRDAEDDEGTRPTRTDIRDSGAIEQDADLIMLLHRPSFYLARKNGEEEKPINVCELIIDKQRDGRTGIVRLIFERPISKFSDSMVDHQPAQKQNLQKTQQRKPIDVGQEDE